MKIAIVGAGRIGTTFGLHLARAGHEVTLVARSKRLEELQKAPAIETVAGERVEVKAAGELDATTPWDLVLVTLFANQVHAVLPALKASAAKKILFMFNTVEPLGRLREAVGAGRFEFGFPTVIASFVDGKLKSSVSGPGQITTVTSVETANLFNAAKIPTVVHSDMESFLRSHAAFVIPLMALAAVVHGRQAGLTFAEARRYARVQKEGFALVRQVGNQLTPGFIVVLAALPSLLVALLFWFASRAASVRELGAMGLGEARELIDAMNALAPGSCPEMVAARP